MNDDEFDRLLDSVLDGSATDDERVALERHMGAHPEMAMRRESREEVFAMLHGGPWPEVPAGVRERILAAVREPERPGPAWRRALESLVARRPGLSLAYAGTLGLVAGSLLSLIAIGAIGRDGHEALVSGTMTPPPHRERAFLARGAIELGNVHIDMKTWRDGDAVQLAVEAQGPGPLDLALTFEPAELRLMSVVPPDDPTATVAVAGGRIEIAAPAPTQFEFRLRSLVARPAPIVVSARAGDRDGRAVLGVTEDAPGSPHGP